MAKINNKSLEILNNLQTQFFRTIFAVGSGCPIPAFYWDTSTLTMENRILQMKLLFIHHLNSLPNNSLASEIFHIQKKMKLPGIWEECQIILFEFGLLNISSYTKLEWKKNVKKKRKKQT